MGSIDFRGVTPTHSQVFSTHRYYAEDYFRAEIENVFRHSWLNVGRLSDVPAPGDFMVRDLHAIGVSALIVHGKDGKVRAFHNVCGHRGNKVVMAHTRKGSARAFNCAFHGWVYDHTGRLVHVPGQHYFTDLDPARHGLRPIHCDTWGGFIYLNLADKPARGLDEYLEPLTSQGLGEHLAEPHWHRAYSFRAEIKANWKFVCDAQLEGYHVESLHARSIAGALPCTAVVPTIFEGNGAVLSRLTIHHDMTKTTPTPLQMLAAELGQGGTYVRSQVDGMKTAHPEVYNLEQRPDWAFDNYGILPNVVLFVQGSGFMIQRAWPVTPQSSVFEMDVYSYGAPANFGEMFNLCLNNYNVRDVLTEDLSTLEHTQANMAHGYRPEIVFSIQEGVLIEFHRRLEELTVNGPLQRESRT